MKSWLLDSEAELVFSHNEGDINVYQLYLKFKDLWGQSQKRFSTVELSSQLKVDVRVSFTAMSSCNLRRGLVHSVSDEYIDILFADGSLRTHNLHFCTLNKGDLVYVVDRVDIYSDEYKMMQIAIPMNISFDVNILTLQAINADLLDEQGKMIYRTSTDPLIPGGCHGTHLAT